MRKQRIEYNTPIDALIAVAKKITLFETKYKLTSEDFYDQFSKGKLGDSNDFIEWANQYQHFLALKTEIEGCLRNVA